MEAYNGLCFERIIEDDVAALTEVMKRAFDEDAKRHLGEECGGPPGYDNGDFIRKWYLQSGAEAYKVSKDGRLIGGINVFINQNNENNLGNMFVDPLCQDKGIGTLIWRFIEHKYPQTKKWHTDTPGFSKRNHNFYVNKCGFKVIRIENPKDKYEESYVLEKEV
jgi:hypothetical protein